MKRLPCRLAGKLPSLLLTFVPLAAVVAFALFVIGSLLLPSQACFVLFFALMTAVLMFTAPWLFFWIRADRWRKISTLNLFYVWLLLDILFVGLMRAITGMDFETIVERWGGFFSLSSLLALAVMQAYLQRKWREEEKGN